ncbi:MAG: ABC transporter ATP-binding protein [Chloroflexi bacterium]|nr:ABC transporter ATP-binding protein [Chloroflexota bacterium]
MGFIMDGLDAEEYDRTYNDRQLVGRILSYFRPQAPRMLLVAFMILLNSALNTAIPVALSRGIDRLQEDTATQTIVILAAVIGGLTCMGWAVNAVRQWFSAVAVGNVVLDLREDAFDAVVKRDLSFYDSFPSGKIVSRVTSDTQSFSQVVGLTMDLMSQVLIVTFLVGYLFSVNVRLALMVMGTAPFIIAAALGFRKIARDTVTQSRRIQAEVSSHIQESISGIGVAKTFRQEHAIYDEFLSVNAQSYRINLRSGYVFNSIFPLLSFIAGIGTGVIVYFGGKTVQDGTLSAGDWYLFVQGLAMFWFPLTSIASFWSQFQLGLAAGERVFALVDAEPKVVQIGSEKLPQLYGQIQFENVDFRYTDNEQVLENFSLHIKPGEKIALVGHTGSGKSSIAKLIARFYEFQSGRILVDDHDIRTLDLENYRTYLGIVTQTPFLFDGTVADNIRYGTQDAHDDDVISVSKQVGGGDWIAGLPNGLQTQVGERGHNLSMGQRQLVALARVLLQDPSIFILDEATASVDPLTETLIQEGLDEVMKRRTSILIAHRLSTIKNADRIIVLREGKIIEEGNHNSLLAQGGHYAELYNTYFRHQSLDYMNTSPAARAEMAEV